ncbi:MAG: peroxiredoxin-like family protein [Planctomycetota bacterium]|nr:peroxiredoxin-like family protein [Planctomycetota bacterium]
MLKSITLAITLLSLGAAFPSGYAEENPIAADAKETKPLKAGAEVPEVSVQSADGKAVTIASLHEKRPVVLVFFRGGWCPICTRHTTELIKSYPEIQELGAEMVGISPDTPENSKGNAEKNSIPFPLLSDADIRATRAFGLAFKVDDATVTKYKGFGIDLEKASGQQHHTLPIPAVYIVDKTGTIIFAHSNPDYSERLDTKIIIAELEKLK